VRVEQTLDRWRNELLDLTPANRLLNFTPGFSRGQASLRILSPSAVAFFDGLVNDGKVYSLYRAVEDDDEREHERQLELVLSDGADQVTDGTASPIGATSRPPRDTEFVVEGDPRKVDAALYRLRIRARSALQEQGVNLLFAAFGALDWADGRARGGRLLSPLFLVPVALTRETALDPYRLEALDEGVVLNPALVRKLERDFGLKLSAPVDDEQDATLAPLLASIQESVKAQPDWRIVSDAFIGLFSFAKLAMYADLAANRERFGVHPVIRLLAGEEEGMPETPRELISADQMDDRITPVETFQVRDADASQQEAIAAVKAGTNLVIQGPPGTGKSQTITNIIAEVLAQQKTVLFVSEKMAALSVVAKRLDEAGLKEFCLVAHGRDANKAAIVHELAATLTASKRPVTGSPDTDLERLARLRG